MNHADHVALLQPGITAPGGTWADLGAGSGAFTLALAEVLGPTGTIYAVDKDKGALRQLAQAMQARFPAITLHTLAADFTRPLNLSLLDGVVMANSLHFHKHKQPVLAAVRSLLKPGGRLILVEYNTDRGNIWVPHPLSYPTWATLAARCGLLDTQRIATRPSSFLGEFYAAVSFAPD